LQKLEEAQAERELQAAIREYLGPTAEAGKSAGNNGHNSNAVAANLWVVTFQTAYSPNPV